MAVDPVNPVVALRRLEQAIEIGGPAFTVAINPEKVMRARRDPDLRQAIDQAALRFPDGIGIVLASRLRGGQVHARVTGIDLAVRLLERCAAREWTVYLLGASPGVAEETAAALSARWPTLSIGGTHHGYFRGHEEDVCRAIEETHSRVLLVALGSPAQEIWLSRHLAHTGCAVGIGVGGAFDVWSGRTERAPAWLRVLGLEWFHRLMKEPWRAKRMLTLPQFLWAAVREPRGPA